MPVVQDVTERIRAGAMEEKDRDYPAGAGAAVAGALAAGADPASRARADAFLEEQTRLARLQVEDMQAENRLRHWSLRVRHISDVMKLAFELALAFILLAIAVGLGAAIWNASQDDGLVVESFSVPPDLSGGTEKDSTTSPSSCEAFQIAAPRPTAMASRMKASASSKASFITSLM